MIRPEIKAAIVAFLGSAWLLAGCADDKGGSPQNTPPVITSLTCVHSIVEPGGYSEVFCSASDPDGDALSFSWAAASGSIAGSGDTVTWYAPDMAGTYAVSVVVSDGRGGSASDTASMDVSGGTFLVRTDDEVLAVDMDGSHFVFHWLPQHLEVLGTRIFLGSVDIWELDHSGNEIDLIYRPQEITFGYTVAVLPGPRFVYLDNRGDSLGFMDSDGTFITKMEMPETSPSSAQNMSGLVVGNRLIISETGTNKLVEVDLSTYEARIFRDFTHLPGWLGDMGYRDGLYYMSQGASVHTFTEQGEANLLIDTEEEFRITGLVVVGRYAYVSAVLPSSLYRIDIFTGEPELVVEFASNPWEVEFLPVDLVAP